MSSSPRKPRRPKSNYPVSSATVHLTRKQQALRPFASWRDAGAGRRRTEDARRINRERWPKAGSMRGTFQLRYASRVGRSVWHSPNPVRCGTTQRPDAAAVGIASTADRPLTIVRGDCPEAIAPRPSGPARLASPAVLPEWTLANGQSPFLLKAPCSPLRKVDRWTAARHLEIGRAARGGPGPIR